MNDASRYLYSVAQRISGAYAELPCVRAIMVTGSVALGESDAYSDIDLIVHHEGALPTEAQLTEARRRNGGSERLWLLGDRDGGSIVESYHVQGGIECQIAHATVAAFERDVGSVLEGLDTSTPFHKALSGTLDAIPLHGTELIQVWKERIALYPDALARAMVEQHLKFFPLWGLQHRIGTRDATLWLMQSLVEAAQNLLGILAGLNRLYYSAFQFKRTRAFVARMNLAPQHFADRLEALLRGDPLAAGESLEALVRETVELIELHMPAVDTSRVRSRIGWRQQPWSCPASGSDQQPPVPPASGRAPDVSA